MLDYFSEYGLPRSLVSDVGTNFISKELRTSVRDSAYLMQCHHHTTMKAMNRQRHAKICQKNYEKCYETNADIYIYIYIL